MFPNTLLKGVLFSKCKKKKKPPRKKIWMEGGREGGGKKIKIQKACLT